MTWSPAKSLEDVVSREATIAYCWRLNTQLLFKSVRLEGLNALSVLISQPRAMETQSSCLSYPEDKISDSWFDPFSLYRTYLSNGYRPLNAFPSH